MRNITYQGELNKNSSHLYTAVMWAGLNGVPTGWRDKFSISINIRKPSNRSCATDLLENIGLIFMGYSQNMKLIRDTLQECSTFWPKIAPFYFTIAGSKKNQAAFITKDRMGPAHIDYLTPENWYVTQTNNYHWTGVCTIRCQYFRDSMDALGREILPSRSTETSFSNGPLTTNTLIKTPWWSPPRASLRPRTSRTTNLLPSDTSKAFQSSLDISISLITRIE